MARVNHIVFVADRSGSMKTICAGACRGYNEFVDGQKKAGGICYVSTLMFDSLRTYLHSRAPIHQVPKIDPKIWAPNSMTALRDAVGEAVRQAQKDEKIIEAWHPGIPVHTTIAIITDGEENDSKIWSRAALQELVCTARIQGFTFLFQAANQDSAKVAEALGIDPDYSGDFDNNDQGVHSSFAVMSRIQLSMRAIP